ncbi:T9SS C-terminal target domain-containing protein [Dysgonomonas sp. 216]|uniref:CotH kinase family protein n=1 Tax=Dysgonomonas sp. 216 TaxID=2302934 RepID=UPI0013D23893|nr:CotH kinase family protein [Dysgonomonas sp. 216]NDW18413.1 T9SS C-terminal target domain-containing protein [Dysgonomonas sp. 216]
MNSRTLLSILFTLFSLTSHATLAIDLEEEYIITCYNAKGGIEIPSDGSYPLMYNSSVGKTTERAFWIINEEQDGKYSIKNALTNQYIKYFANNYDTRYVELANNLDTQNNTTLFTFIPVVKNGTEYYAIASVANPDHVFNRRTSGIVGTYECKNRNYYDNELFTLNTKNSLPAEGGDGKLFTYLSSFSLNNKDLSSCKDSKMYYYSIPLNLMKSDIPLIVKFEVKNANYTLRIENEDVLNGASFTFKDVAPAKEYKIEILQGNSVIATESLSFTGLPIVQLYTNGNSLSTSFQKGQIRVHDSENKDSYELLNAEIRYRGAITLNYQKKSFSVKIKDENWNNLDKSYFGFRNDKYWILDAMAIDKSRMRNRVCTDIWNDFSTDPHYKSEEPNMINGTRGQFVEVFLDDKYWGIYCMTERIDRKQLKLKKFKEDTQQVRGLLYKTSDWSYSVMMGYRPGIGVSTNYPLTNYNNNNVEWDKHEGKYPDVEDGEPFDWKPLYDVVKLVAHGTNSNFVSKIPQYIDIPVWADYYLLMEMIMATDNHGKNAYLNMYNITEDQILGITPWDMDAVLGRRWNASAVGASQDYTQYIINSEHGEHNLFRRLKLTNAADFNDLLKKQYDKLRFTHFSPENMFNRFENYKRIFENSGAAVREIDRWNGVNGITVDFDAELAYLHKWLQDRAEYMNEQYGEPIGNSIEENQAFDYFFYPNPVSDKLYISNIEQGTPIQIYTQHGIRIYSGKADANSTIVDFTQYTSGCYYLKVGNDKGKLIMKH